LIGINGEILFGEVPSPALQSGELNVNNPNEAKRLGIYESYFPATRRMRCKKCGIYIKIFSFHKTIGFTSYAIKCHGVAIPKCANDYPQSPEGTALYSTGCKSCENNTEIFLERIFQKTNITFFTAH